MPSAPAGSGWNPLSSRFVFATGIECSYPTVSDVAGRRVRVDQLEQTFHYHYWQQDLALVRELGLRWLRYGPPYYRVDRRLIYRKSEVLKWLERRDASLD